MVTDIATYFSFIY